MVGKLTLAVRLPPSLPPFFPAPRGSKVRFRVHSNVHPKGTEDPVFRAIGDRKVMIKLFDALGRLFVL